MATDLKDLARRNFEQLWNSRQLDIADEQLSANFVQHEPQSPFPIQGVKAYKQFVQYYLAAFPDLHFTIDDIVAEGDTVVTRWTATGTHEGNLPGIPATRRSISVTGMVCGRVENGKFVESWSNWDALGMLQQLGVAPTRQIPQAA
jgi:steroid delta-isomerase-like uncharacterized protein